MHCLQVTRWRRQLLSQSKLWLILKVSSVTVPLNIKVSLTLLENSHHHLPHFEDPTFLCNRYCIYLNPNQITAQFPCTSKQDHRSWWESFPNFFIYNKEMHILSRMIFLQLLRIWWWITTNGTPFSRFLFSRLAEKNLTFFIHYQWIFQSTFSSENIILFGGNDFESPLHENKFSWQVKFG